ncbi:MAG: hypothetical protein QOG67_1645 [Verrucomicrobiota bacterium]|jgi:hypothetical protein
MKKKLFLSLAAFALAFAAPRVATADVSVDFFYNNLSGGSWIEVGDYGYCWQPDVAVSTQSWRPYADGYWAYTDLGWTWVSYEDFGWATYHYGRWTRLSDVGWIWVPGRDADLEWGPAWVSWRTGGEYVGWAPLPPETIGLVENRPLSGHLDVEFNIGPEYYNFVDVRYIGEPVLRERIVAPTQNVTYIQQTVNVTNITYKNKTVYNYGPNIEVINRVSARPIQRLRLERQENVDFSAAAKSGALTKVQGDRLVVGAPMRITRSATTVAPPTVKTKVEKANVDRGWSAVGDEKAQAEFKQKIKNQDLKKVPPPTGAGAAVQNTNAGASTSPAAAGAAAGTDTSAQSGRGRQGRRGNANVPQAASPIPGTSPVEGASAAPGTNADAAAERGQGRGRQGKQLGQPREQNAPVGATSPAEATPMTGAETSSASGANQGRGRQGGHREALSNPPAGGASAGDTTAPATTTSPAASGADQSTGGGAHNRRNQLQPGGPPTGGGSPESSADQQGPRVRHLENQGPNAANRPAEEQGPAKHRGQRAEEGATPGQQGQGQRGGKKAKTEASPAPSPQ